MPACPFCARLQSMPNLKNPTSSHNQRQPPVRQSSGSRDLAPNSRAAIVLVGLVTESLAADPMSASPATYVFADIAGFTALTEAHGDEEAAGLIDRFCAEVGEALPRFGG